MRIIRTVNRFILRRRAIICLVRSFPMVSIDDVNRIFLSDSEYRLKQIISVCKEWSGRYEISSGCFFRHKSFRDKICVLDILCRPIIDRVKILTIGLLFKDSIKTGYTQIENDKLRRYARKKFLLCFLFGFYGVSLNVSLRS